MSTLIRNGHVVTTGDEYVADLLIEDGAIALIGRGLHVAADRVIDAEGRYVIPGGIDPHTHLESPIPMQSSDDFTAGTIGAAFGGTTCVIDFCGQQPGQSIAAALADWHERLRRCPPVVDVGFHILVTDLREGGSIEELDWACDEGVTSYKLFMAYKGLVQQDDETIFRVLEQARESSALVMVHAENGDVVDLLVRRALADGHTEPIWHARTRPPLVEAEAAGRAIKLAAMAGAPLYIVHCTCSEVVEEIAAARRAGQDVWGETCPQYLFVDETFLERPLDEAVKFVFTPPARPIEHQAHLWAALAKGEIQTVASDHSAWSLEQKRAGAALDFAQTPNGAPGIENRLDLLYEYGVRSGRITMQQFVAMTSTISAKLFGLYPRKGTIAVGSDADLVIWGTDRRRMLSPETHHSRAGFSLYEGIEVTGGAELVMVRGNVVVDDGRLVAEPGVGEFVKRARYGQQLVRGETVTA